MMPSDANMDISMLIIAGAAVWLAFWAFAYAVAVICVAGIAIRRGLRRIGLWN
jgi:hypothetical protein